MENDRAIEIHLLRSGRRFRARVLDHAEGVAGDRQLLVCIPPTDTIACAAGGARDAGCHGRRRLIHLEILDGEFFDWHCRRVHVWRAGEGVDLWVDLLHKGRGRVHVKG